MLERISKDLVLTENGHGDQEVETEFVRAAVGISERKGLKVHY